MSSPQTSAEASNLTFAQTYILASKVKNKLTKEASNPKSLLWNLVVQANMFDNLMDHITKETEKRARDRSTTASTPRRVSFLLPKKESSVSEYLSPLAAASTNYTHQSQVTEYEVASDSDSEDEDEDDYYYSDEEQEEELHRGASLQVEALGHAVTTYDLSVDLADSESDEEDDYYYSESDDDELEQELEFAVSNSLYKYPLSRNNSVIGLSSIQEEFEEENMKGPEEIDLAEIVSVSELPELTRSTSSSDLESDEEHHMHHHRHHESTYIEPVVTRNKKHMTPSEVSAGEKYHHQQHNHHRHTNAIYTIESVF